MLVPGGTTQRILKERWKCEAALKPMSGVEQEDRESFQRNFESDSKKIEEITQEGFGSDKTRIVNQVRLKAQL